MHFQKSASPRQTSTLVAYLDSPGQYDPPERVQLIPSERLPPRETRVFRLRQKGLANLPNLEGDLFAVGILLMYQAEHVHSLLVTLLGKEPSRRFWQTEEEYNDDAGEDDLQSEW